MDCALPLVTDDNEPLVHCQSESPTLHYAHDIWLTVYLFQLLVSYSPVYHVRVSSVIKKFLELDGLLTFLNKECPGFHIKQLGRLGYFIAST